MADTEIFVCLVLVLVFQFFELCYIGSISCHVSVLTRGILEEIPERRQSPIQSDFIPQPPPNIPNDQPMINPYENDERV
jgi:hypothetical protein